MSFLGLLIATQNCEDVVKPICCKKTFTLVLHLNLNHQISKPFPVPSQEDVLLHDGHEGPHFAAHPLRHLLYGVHSMVPLLQVSQLLL